MRQKKEQRCCFYAKYLIVGKNIPLINTYQQSSIAIATYIIL